MIFHFYSNYCTADNAHLSGACLFTDRPAPDCNEENPGFVRLAAIPSADLDSNHGDSAHVPELSTFTTRSAPPGSHTEGQSLESVDQECRSVQHDVLEFSRSTPTILFASPKAARTTNWNNRSSPALDDFASLTVVSSARTMELYSSGEYVTTLRGNPFPVGLAGSSKPVPLFKIHVGKESLPPRSHSLLFKFFIPSQSRIKSSGTTGIPGTLFLHWLVIQGSVQDTRGSTPAVDISSPTTVGVFPPPSQSSTLASLGTLPPSLSSTIAAGSGPGSEIDLLKIRELLGQVQLDSLPQGAKQLMKAMETQASMSRGFSPYDPRLQLYAVGAGLSLPGPSPSQSTPQESPDSTTSSATDLKVPGSESPIPKATTTSGHGDQSTFVTRKELERMEERIMAMIESRFKEMEERIVDRILSTKRKVVDQEYIDS
ncbi:hypothetical protein B0O80DRAFT_494103 [Mortierella sp. GBAus27b]|nr:hypothetical protein BGX31_000374 [Mortierella sp. GBA43]KAI8361558.1 hypothetical protein B0O80DRAFT_494103 [Mortierella sp. GBAus27b]